MTKVSLGTTAGGPCIKAPHLGATCPASVSLLLSELSSFLLPTPAPRYNPPSLLAICAFSPSPQDVYFTVCLTVCHQGQCFPGRNLVLQTLPFEVEHGVNFRVIGNAASESKFLGRELGQRTAIFSLPNAIYQ